MATKTKKPDPNAEYVCLLDFANDATKVKRGDKLPGSDPLVRGNPDWFVPATMPDSAVPSTWDVVPSPPEHKSPIPVGSAIPAYRQVRALTDRWLPAQWAPGSPGAEGKGGAMPFGNVVTQRGLMYDVLDERVRLHPEEFEWVTRPVTLEDVERIERLEREGDQAVR